MSEANGVSIEDRFHFDLLGFVLLRNVLSKEHVTSLLEVINCLEDQSYDDEWMASAVTTNARRKPRPTLQIEREHQVRLNGLIRLNSAFDSLVDHPRVLPYLKEFIGDPQLISTWSISKHKGAQQAGWHRGAPATDYTYWNGDIRSRMLNVVWFLTDNGPEDGCIIALPGAHKSNFDLKWQDYQGLDLPGSVAVSGSAGDVLMFSETVIHNGLPKTTDGVRTNLYYNYTHAHFSVTSFDPPNSYHKCFPPEIRDRFTPDQRELTRWMEFGRTLEADA